MMKKSKYFSLFFLYVFAFLFASLWFCGSAYADFNLQKWEFYKNIKTEGRKGFVAFYVDKEIYDASINNLLDLRIISNSEEIPYLISTDKGEKGDKEISLSIAENYIEHDKQNAIVLKLNKIKQHNKLLLDIENENFARRVQIEGSNNKQNWHLLTREGYIYSFKSADRTTIRYKQLSNQREDILFNYTLHNKISLQKKEVEYPKNNYTYLKITIPFTIYEDPLRIRGAKVFYHYFLPADKQKYEAKITKVGIDKERKVSEFIADFEVQNIHFYQLSLFPSTKNYYREVKIEGSNNLKDWDFLGTRAIFDYNLENFKQRKSELKFSSRGYRYLKISVFNYDNQPIGLNKCFGYALRKKVIFKAEKGKKYALFYGNKRANKPIYDLGKILKHITLRNIPIINVGKQIKNKKFIPHKKPWTENPHLLWAAMAISIAILLLFSARLIKKTNS